MPQAKHFNTDWAHKLPDSVENCPECPGYKKTKQSNPTHFHPINLISIISKMSSTGLSSITCSPTPTPSLGFTWTAQLGPHHQRSYHSLDQTRTKEPNSRGGESDCMQHQDSVWLSAGLGSHGETEVNGHQREITLVVVGGQSSQSQDIMGGVSNFPMSFPILASS